MKYYKRLKIYKASNVEFNPQTCQAYSYGWWRFVDKINGKIVFNDYRYSPSTSRHQWKIRSLLSSLGIKIDFYIEAPEGLQKLNSAVEHYQYEITLLQNAINKPRSRKTTNAWRQAQIEEMRDKIYQVKNLMGISDLKQALDGTYRVLLKGVA